MQQLDWLTEYYKISNTVPKGIKIWYRKDTEEYPDLDCNVTGIEGQYVGFYVINGDWYGKLDMASRLMTIYCPDEHSVVSYTKCEFIYEEEAND